jgi:hypothetical protein
LPLIREGTAAVAEVRSLALTTRRMLVERPRKLTLRMIADEIGITERWLLNFASGKTPNPGVNTVQALYEYLAGKELAL